MSSKKNSLIKNTILNKFKHPIFELKKYDTFIIDDFNLNIPLIIKTKNLFISCNDSENIVYLYKSCDDSVNQKWIIEKNTGDTYFIKSYSTNKYLGSNDMNNVILFDEINQNTVWNLKKFMKNFKLTLVNNNIVNMKLLDSDILIIGKNTYNTYDPLQQNLNNIIVFNDLYENMISNISKIRNNFF
jgi:hypothetical protein